MESAVVEALVSDGVGYQQKQEPLRALAELDRDLHSARAGTQQTAVAAIGSLLRSHGKTSLSLVNAAFLKLADVFRGADNHTRLAVCSVVRENVSVLGTAVSFEEVLRRIHSVVHSNDPVARAVTLRAVAAMAPLLRDRVLVHHSVRRSLGSSHPIELSCAVGAADRLCAVSGRFAEGVFPQIAELASDPRLDGDMRARVVRVFRHMHFTSELTRRAHDTLSAMVASCQQQQPRQMEARSQSMVITAMETLTRLSCRSLIDIPAQRASLESVVEDGCSPNTVKAAALTDLAAIAAVSPRSGFSIPMVLRSLRNPDLQHQAFVLLRVLGSSIYETILKDHSKDICEAYEGVLCADSPPSAEVQVEAFVAANAIVSRADPSTGGLDHFVSVVTKAAVIIIERGCVAGGIVPRILPTLTCLVKLSNEAGTAILRAVTARLFGHGAVAADQSVCDAEAMARFIARVSRVRPSLLAGLPEMRNATGSKPTLPWSPHVRSSFAIAMVQHSQPGGAPELLDRANAELSDLFSSSDLWECFRVARAAFCSGNHSVSGPTFARLFAEARDFESQSWLRALSSISEAERALFGSGLCDAHGSFLHFNNALVDIGTASPGTAKSSDSRFAFQRSFIAARMQFIHGAASLLSFLSCNIRWTCGLGGICTPLLSAARAFGALLPELQPGHPMPSRDWSIVRSCQAACCLLVHCADVLALSLSSGGEQKPPAPQLPLDLTLVLLESRNATDGDSPRLLLHCKQSLDAPDSLALPTTVRGALQPLEYPRRFFKYS